MTQQIVYILCAATSLLCAILLARGFLRTRARLLLWSCLCFIAMFINNMLLFVDKIVMTEQNDLFGVEFQLLRAIAAFVGMSVLLFGLIWDSEQELSMDHRFQELLTEFLLGGVVVCCAMVGLFFLRFYRKTHDRLLAIFAIAFWVLGLNWAALAFAETDEVRTLLYAVRFLAFLAIFLGIWDKNRSPRRNFSASPLFILPPSSLRAK